jgi:hypothetical protein
MIATHLLYNAAVVFKRIDTTNIIYSVIDLTYVLTKGANSSVI